MAKVDKIVAAGRTYSVVLLTLAVAVTFVGTTGIRPLTTDTITKEETPSSEGATA